MTAEDAGAGVQAGTLVLTVRPEGAAPVPLPLHEAEPLIGDWSGQPAVEAGVPVSLEVSGLPPRAAVTVRMGGEVLAGDQYREEDCVHLELQDPLPFDNMIGVAKLEVLVSMGPQACSFFYAEPLRIILKPGLASDNLLRMSAWRGSSGAMPSGRATIRLAIFWACSSVCRLSTRGSIRISARIPSAGSPPLPDA